MSDGLIINMENHRSRVRIKDMGEVFTPEEYVYQMLALFDDKVWADESVVFFEPTVGHGNIVLPILDKRISALGKKYKRAKVDKPVLCAVANAVNTIWAVDVCPLNVELTRKRIFSLVINYLVDGEYGVRQPKMRNFLAHVLCTLLWQIQENDVLSALETKNSAISSGSKTKLGRAWLKSNKHKPIDFSMDWCEHFKLAQREHVIPDIFLKALRFVDSSLQGNKIRGFAEFDFAKDSIQFLASKPSANDGHKGAA